MKKYILRVFWFVLLILLFIQCSKENTYVIEKGKVGLLNTDTEVKDLKNIFATDSIVSALLSVNSQESDEKESFFDDADEYEIFSSSGEKLLAIIPVEQRDSTSKLKSIQIFNAKYKTTKGLNLMSTFSDIKSNYTINKVETTLTSAMLYIDELNATIAIDKEEIGLPKFSREKVSVDQIPEVSRIKFFTIWFN